jgi:hypothetical protein
MYSLIKLRAKREIMEIQSIHKIAMAELEAKLNRANADKVSSLAIQEKELKKSHELQIKEVVTLLKLESEQKIKQIELDHARMANALRAEKDNDVNKIKEELLKDQYDKLSAAMTKLHEEGNVTTRFTQDLAMKMLASAPHQKHTTKVLTGKIKDDDAAETKNPS